MSYTSEKTKGQAMRRIKSDEKKLISEFKSIDGIDTVSLLKLDYDNMNRLIAILPKIQKFNDKLQLVKSKGLEYDRVEIQQSINTKLLDRLKTKYSTATQISMKSTYNKEEFKKELIKRCANSIIGYDDRINNTLDSFYDSIKIEVPVIEPILKDKKIKQKPSTIDDTENIFNNIMTRE